jgi:hypothetical protein
LSAIGLVVLLGTAWRRPLLDASSEAGRVGAP